MHNLHYVRVKANSGEEACQFAESALMDFGNENNWRTMCGAVSQDNEVYNAGDGRYIPMNTNASVIEAINDQVNGWIKSCWNGKIAEDKFAKGETNLDEWEFHELYSLSKWANHLTEKQKELIEQGKRDIENNNMVSQDVAEEEYSPIAEDDIMYQERNGGKTKKKKYSQSSIVRAFK
jgi:hypothetical protein